MAKQKKINFEPIHDTSSEPWQILRKIREASHPHLAEATFVLAWRKALKCDKDGILMLGKAKKMGDLDREVADYDLLILLNKEHWLIFDREQREALIDHELCHFQVCTNKDGSVKCDEKDRICYRIRKHDVEEFHEVVERHGVYKRDLEIFAEKIKRSKATPLFPPEAFGEEPATTNGEAHETPAGRKKTSARPRSPRKAKA